MSSSYNFRVSTLSSRVERDNKNIKTTKKANMTVEIIPKEPCNYNFRASTLSARMERQKKSIKTTKNDVNNVTIEIIPKVEEYQIVKLTDEYNEIFKTGISSNIFYNRNLFDTVFKSMLSNAHKYKTNEIRIKQFIEIWKMLLTNAGLDMMKMYPTFKLAVIKKIFELMPQLINILTSDAVEMVLLMSKIGTMLYQ